MQEVLPVALAVLAGVAILLTGFWLITGGQIQKIEDGEPHWSTTDAAQPMATVTRPIIRSRRPDGLPLGAPETQAERDALEMQHLRRTIESMAIELWLRPPVPPLVRWLAEGPGSFEDLCGQFPGSDPDQVQEVIDLYISLGHISTFSDLDGLVYRWAGPFHAPIGY